MFISINKFQGVRLSIFVALAVLVVYAYLALHAPLVFETLVYDEVKLMPSDVEPMVVRSILEKKSDRGPEAVTVVIFGPSLEEKARRLSELYNATTPWSVLDRALEVYWSKIGEVLNESVSKFREGAVRISNGTREACDRLQKLENAYREARETARRLLFATYGVAAAGVAVDSDTEKFLEVYRRLLDSHDVDDAVRLAADVAYGNVSRYLAGVSWRNWSSESAVESVAEAILASVVNETALQLAREVNVVGVRQYVYLSTLGEVPPLFRPYLPYLICGGDVERVVNWFRDAVVKNLTQMYPPPTVYTVAAGFIYEDKYALSIAPTDKIPTELGVPISSSSLLHNFQEIVVEDVSKIDKATAAALFVVLLYIMGALTAPVVILSAVGLTYLSALGFIYVIHEFQKIYYMTVYMAAPVVFAIGVDYMLLMVSRYAEERASGRNKREAVAVVRRYASRAIAASAAVVAVALGSFALSTLPLMQSVGFGYLIAVAFIAATIFFVFPAVLYVLGDKLFWPRRITSIHTGRSKVMERAVEIALRRPKLITAISTAVTLLSLAFVVTTLHITANPIAAMPETQHKKALEVAVTHFPSVASLSNTYLASESDFNPELLRAIETLPHYVNHTVEKIGKWQVVTIRLSLEETADELLEIYEELDKLRAEYGYFLIGGSAAWKNIVFNEIYVKFWNFQMYVVIAAVIVILAILLRSLVMPLRLVTTVLMSTAWSFALGVLIFQEVAMQSIYWLTPIVLFAFLMAIGTDYDIFIVTRIREEMEGGLSEREAIKKAIVTTGPVITGAAIILAVAFSTLSISQTTVLQQVGFTVALAALIDAFVIRPFVVPSLMVLAGRYNWLWVTGYAPPRGKF